MPHPPKKLSRRIKPALDTPFHIDFEWWQQEGRDLHAYLLSQISADLREAYAELDDGATVDTVNPETGEVQQEDGLLQRVRAIAKQRADFVNQHTSIIDAVFRTFLVNDNKPLTSYELSRHLNRDAELILRTLSGAQVYKGLRPCTE